MVSGSARRSPVRATRDSLRLLQGRGSPRIGATAVKAPPENVSS